MQTRMLFLTKLVIHVIISHGFSCFQGSKYCIGFDYFKDDLKSPSTPLNGSSTSVIRDITTPLSLHNIYQNDSSVKKLLNVNHQNFPQEFNWF